MKYTVVKSTSNQFTGIAFSCDELTVQCIKEALHKSEIGTLNLTRCPQTDIYVASNRHFMLFIKEEEE